jgi:hypothetical protein
MNFEDLINKNNMLEEENEKLKKELIETKEQLDIYLLKNKKYYEKNKEQHKKRVKEYKENTNYSYEISPDKKKQYARTAYLNKKEKLKNMENKKENI